MTLDLSHLSERVSPAAQNRLKNRIARAIIQANKRRMSAQSTPDGAKWQARSKTSGGRGKMMKKLRNQLSIKDQGDELRIGFFGRTGNIANTHHFGLSEQLHSGLAVYPARELIGISADDENMIEEMVRQMIDGGL